MTSLVPLGDQAVLAYFAEEAKALRFAAVVRAAPWPWLVDVVLAYASVAVYFETEQIALAEVAEQLRELERAAPSPGTTEPGKLHTIPCCYGLGLDLDRVARHTGLSSEEIVRLHSDTIYTVYAIGFCPGFPYLGYLPTVLCGTPRLDSPRVRVEPGMVGLTGRQTGIYTEPRPGGWNLIGCTPLQLVEVRAGYFPLHAGDRVQFRRIDEAEFERLRGRRL